MAKMTSPRETTKDINSSMATWISGMMRYAFLKSAAKVEVFSAKMLHSKGENEKAPEYRRKQNTITAI